MNTEKRYFYLDTSLSNADWIKKSFDLPHVKTLEDLAIQLEMGVNSLEFRQWLSRANNLPWVDDAPTEIRLAIRAQSARESQE